MRRAIALLVLLAGATAQGADVTVTYGDGKLGARIEALPFPDTLPKELTSGLTNRIYSRVSLRAARDVIAHRVVEVAIRYDLWDEKFSVVSTMDGAVFDSRVLANLAEVSALLTALPLPRLFDAATLPAAQELVLSAEVLLNPLDREKVRMIRKWVTQNSTELGAEQGVSVSNTLFNRIFEQYADGSTVAATWRVQLSSRPFKLGDLRHEGR